VKKNHSDWHYFQSDVIHESCHCYERINELGSRLSAYSGLENDLISDDQLFDIDQIINSINTAPILAGFLDQGGFIEPLRLEILEGNNSTMVTPNPPVINIVSEDLSFMSRSASRTDLPASRPATGKTINPSTEKLQARRKDSRAVILSRDNTKSTIDNLRSSFPNSTTISRDNSSLDDTKSRYKSELENGVNDYLLYHQTLLNSLQKELSMYKSFAENEIFHGRDYSADHLTAEEIMSNDGIVPILEKYLTMTKTHEQAAKVHTVLQQYKNHDFPDFLGPERLTKSSITDILYCAYHQNHHDCRKHFESEHELDAAIETYIRSKNQANLKQLYDESQLIVSSDMLPRATVFNSTPNEDELNALIRTNEGKLKVLEKVYKDFNGDDQLSIWSLAGPKTMFKTTVLAKAAEVHLTEKKLAYAVRSRDIIDRNKSPVLDFLVQRDSEILEQNPVAAKILAPGIKSPRTTSPLPTIPKSPFKHATGEKQLQVPKSLGEEGISQIEKKYRDELDKQLDVYRHDGRLVLPPISKSPSTEKDSDSDDSDRRSKRDRRNKLRDQLRKSKGDQDDEIEATTRLSKFKRSKLSKNGMQGIGEEDEYESSSNSDGNQHDDKLLAQENDSIKDCDSNNLATESKVKLEQQPVCFYRLKIHNPKH